MPKFTKGKWVANPDTLTVHQDDGWQARVADALNDNLTPDECVANMNLIADAPDMWVLLMEFVKDAKVHGEPGSYRVQLAEIAHALTVKYV